MSAKFLRTLPLRPTAPVVQYPRRAFFSTTFRAMASNTVDTDFVTKINAAEKALTGQSDPFRGGPTARAQAHAGNPLTAQVIADIAEGERVITGPNQPVQKSGPTAIAQSILTQLSSSMDSSPASGKLDSDTISTITEKEKQLSGLDQPVKGGPTARAQQHAGEEITSQALHDITEGEKEVTGGERVKGGPTAAAQSELAHSKQ
ncbi:hypothetical protein P280DRAFT_473609 [Massarina eburnea CBS 473.64]|uniref:SMP domain-containing protein n=1 Tax=Massarina eburnea CBS 473.64 TaxID=1395130 RepID=A0A6A6RKH7_9PLEO|nr:hypothetical protein P280DRAFT_473609 [Massarina eburnea CBS 473.64]